MSQLQSPIIISSRAAPTATQLFVEQTYKTVLFRVPDRAGLNSWVDQIDKGQIDPSNLEKIFKATEEGQSIQKDLSIVGLYDAILNRAPDAAGFETWSNALKSGNLTLVEIARAMAQSKEAMTIYQSYDDTRENIAIASRNLSMTPIDDDTQSVIHHLIHQGNDFAQIITKFVVGSTEAPIETIYEKLLTQNYNHQYGFYKGYGFFDTFVPISNERSNEGPFLNSDLQSNPSFNATKNIVVINGTPGNDHINPAVKTGSYRINGLEGNDVIDGSSGGNNIVVGGPGNDVIKAYDNDTIFPGWNFIENSALAGQSSGSDIVTIHGSGTFYQSSGEWLIGPGGNDFVNYNVVGQGKLTFLPVTSGGAGRTNIGYEYCTSWGPADASGWRYSDDTIHLAKAANIPANQLTFRDTDYYVIQEGQALGITILSYNSASDFFRRLGTGGSGIYFEQGNIQHELVVINTYNSLYYSTQFGIAQGSVPWNPKPTAEYWTVDAPGEWSFFYIGGGRGDNRDAYLRYFDTVFNEVVDVIFPSDGYAGLVRDGFANNDVNGLKFGISNGWLEVWD